jgi:hypothetical protein
MDSNFQYAEAVKLVVARFSCAGCLGRVGAPVGVLRFSSFLCAASDWTEPGSYDIDRPTPLALIAARFEDQVHLAESLHRGQSAAEEAKRLLDVRWPGASGVPVMGIAEVH